MPFTGTEEEILIAPKAAAGHDESAAEGHSSGEADDHTAEPTGHDAMTGMDMGIKDRTTVINR